MTQIIQNNEQWLLSGDVVFANASMLLSESIALNFTQPTTIDFKEVTDVDTSAISLILEWERRAKVEKASIKFINFPQNLVSLAKLYGVDEIIAS
ncbi:MAG: STAS domain-containing protein [Methylophilaceae bacterium]|nr:STAS domain-containing protein [Methylophilaceae bacterium]